MVMVLQGSGKQGRLLEMLDTQVQQEKLLADQLEHANQQLQDCRQGVH